MRTIWVVVATSVATMAPLTAQQQPQSSVLGRRVELQFATGAPALAGELLAAARDSAWLLAAGPSRVIAVPMASVEQATIRRHGLTASKGFLWGLTVGVVSGIGLSAACNSFGSECGGVLPGAMLAGALFGGISALSFHISSRQVMAPVTSDALTPFARFPQGPPPGASLTELGEAPRPER